ncbi:hypothetical protein ACWGH8_06700 [Nonomuraea muscovyensis]|jgi:hypothetical protein|uniref:Uncharacterized protein n=1 Tax=Nonomuraea muscovyensis TaxID=1124761 RepID=A0A7X0F1B5_9ACTN|nr:hypothetical protein [Nonomuraea muscovyensis]MBB6349399.1 hypothetical protein [Nonomuraea muscovyensis]MDF2711336.1 hypothetical protein [Nonomuraea muscovyensis]
MTATDKSPTFLRVALLLQTLALLLQAVTAGLLLSSPGGRTTHAASAVAVLVTVLLHLVAALLARRSDVILPAVGMLVMTLAQMALGVLHLKTLHVPLGVLMFGGSMLQLGRVWAGRRVTVATA